MNKSKSTNCVSISNRTGGRYAPVRIDDTYSAWRTSNVVFDRRTRPVRLPLALYIIYVGPLQKTYSRVKPTCSSNGNDDNHPSSSSTATKKIRLDLLRLLNVSSETIAEAIGLDRKLLEITHLRLRILSEDCDFKLLMKKDYPMVRLKNVYYAYFKLPMGSLCFTYNGYNVMDSDTVILLEMKKDDTIHITPKPAGGMYE